MASVLNHLLAKTRAPLAALLLVLGVTQPAAADIDENFSGASLAPAWTAEDGFAAHYPGDVADFASFQVTGSQLSISFPGGREHNQWWFDHAQVVRAFPGDGVYEIKVDSALTGSQQFGLTFEGQPGSFMQFMLYSTDQVYAYVERFANVSGYQYKTTVAGSPLNLSVPQAGPWYLRVTLQGHASPGSRTWTFAWSKNGSSWNQVASGVLETWNLNENAGTLQRVGVFAGNQPPGFSGFDARFDYFRHIGPVAPPLGVPAGVAIRGSDHRVELWWDPVPSADSYRVYRATSAGGPYTSQGVVTQTEFTDLTVANGTRYYYTVSAYQSGQESAKSTAVSMIPHVVADLPNLPTTGRILAISASELAYQFQSGETVTMWPNALGARAASRGTNGPTLITSALNGKPVVRFDGVDDYFNLPQGFQDFSAGLTAFIVARPTVLQSGFKLLALGNGPSQQNIVLGRAGTTSGLQFFTDNSSGNVAWFNTNSGLVAGEASILSVSQAAGTPNSQSYAYVSKNGAALGGQNVWMPPVVNRTVNYLGRSFWNEGMFQGDIAEVLVYNRALTPAEETTVRNYLNTKYGLGGSAPPPPLSAPATLSATAGNSTVALSWGAVTGATGYRVHRADSPSDSFVQIAQVSGTSTADNSVVNGVTYRYKVTAYNATQESAATAEVTATPTLPPGPDPLPGIPTNGLILSLDATTEALQTAAGSPVTVWDDETANGYNAVNGGSGAPTLVANAINGRPALRFDGVDDYLSLPAGFQNFTAGMTLYIVARPTVLQSGFKLLALGNGGGLQNIVLGRAGSTNGLQYFTDSSSNGVEWFNTDYGLTVGAATLFSLVQEAGAANTLSYAEVGADGEALGGKNVWVPPVTSRGVNYIGRSYWTEGMFQGDIAEILLYNRRLSASEQATVRSYVAQKYGLSLP